MSDGGETIHIVPPDWLAFVALLANSLNRITHTKRREVTPEMQG